jgi:hypothetical protein
MKVKGERERERNKNKKEKGKRDGGTIITGFEGSQLCPFSLLV